MSDQKRTNDESAFPNCQVSLICFTLTDPSGATYNYYSGLVDLPADTSGGWNYALDNASPDYNNPITYNPDTNQFTIGYSLPETMYNPAGTYKTFMLPFYTDEAALSASVQMSVIVNINLTNGKGVTNKTIVKQGTVSTIRTVRGNLGPAGPATLDLIQYIPTGNPDGMNCWNGIIKSCTQDDQYFVVLWACIPQSDGAMWPLMWKPNASSTPEDSGSSAPPQIICNWWNWDQSPAVNRSIPAPNPIPPYTAIIGSIVATEGQYTTVAIEGNDPGPDFSNYYQYATPM